jgi:hypothetical protein
MLMDRVYCFGDVNEQVYFSDVTKLGKWRLRIGDVNEQDYHFQLVMFMDGVYHFGDVNEKVYFNDVNKLGKWRLVMLINRDFVFNWWC